MSKQLLDLGHRYLREVGVERSLLRFVPGLAESRTARMPPIQSLGVVETQWHPLLPAFLHNWHQQVLFPRRGSHRIPFTDLGIEKGEPVMVLGGDHHVLHAGLPRETHPCGRIVAIWRKAAGILRVVCLGNAGVMHDPFAKMAHRLAVVNSGWDGIHTPMHEHPKLGVLPPLKGTFIRLADCCRSAAFVHSKCQIWQE